MKSLLHLIAVLAVVILIGCVTFDFPFLKEPRYQGRTLTQWLEPERKPKNSYSYRSIVHTRVEPKSEEVQRAVKAIGTNAIPVFLKMAQAKDSFLKTSLNSLLDQQTIIHFRFRSASEQRVMAFQGFEILAEDAKSAAPALALLTKNSNAGVRYTAIKNLYRVRPDKDMIVPVLLLSCHDPDSSIRFLANVGLRYISPQELERAGIPDMLLSIHAQAKNNVEVNAPAATK